MSRGNHARSVLATAALAAAAVLAGPALARAAAPSFTCEASALRGTLLGQTIEPVVFGRGQACRTGQATPTVSVPAVLDAGALVAQGQLGADAANPSAVAAGGLAGAKVKLLPSLPITLPDLSPLVDALPDVTIPLAGLPTAGLPILGGAALPPTATVSIKDAVRSLLPNLQLPNADLLSTDVLSSVAVASCVSGKLGLTGASTVTGLKILGQNVNLDGTLQQNVNVIDTSMVDPSKVTVAQIQSQLPAAVQAAVNLPGGTAALQAALQPVLDAIPDIVIPPTVAQVKLTAGTQTKDATSLTQQALRVQASILGQSLVDAVVGEAKVSATGDCPRVAASGSEPAELQCTDRKLVLLDVFEEKGRVRLRGAANKNFVSKLVDIRYRAGGNKVVARAKVDKNGEFTTTAALPITKVRSSNASRYTAVRGSERSLPLKLVRRMRTSSVTSKGGFVTIKGRLTKPLASPIQEIRLIRRVACGKAQLVKRFKPKADGSFSVRIKASSRPAVYRATTRVRKTASNPKTYPTFTLPRGVDLSQR